MLGERGLDVSYETVRRWFLKFGSTIAANLRRTRLRAPNSRALDRRLVQAVWRAQAVQNVLSRRAAFPEAAGSMGP
jgi:putative transposase